VTGLGVEIEVTALFGVDVLYFCKLLDILHKDIYMSECNFSREDKGPTHYNTF
jgi:hypothetical protein